MRSLILFMRLSQPGMQRAMPTHQKKYASRGSDARQETREKRQNGAEIGEGADYWWQSDLLREDMQRRGVFVKRDRFAPKPQHFGVGAEKEKYSGQNGAPLHRARDAGQGIAGFRSKGCRAFKTNGAEHCQHQSQPQFLRCDAMQGQLRHIRTPSVFQDNADG